MMPNKTIYISDADLPIFEKAQELAGDNLSATIVQALRKFIEAHDTREQEFHEITVKVGKVVHTYKRFNGRRLAKGVYGGTDDSGARKIEIYQTAKGRIAVYTEYLPREWFSSWRGGIGRHGRERKHDWMGWWEELAT